MELAIAVIRIGDRPEVDCIFRRDGDRMSQADILGMAIALNDELRSPISFLSCSSSVSFVIIFLPLITKILAWVGNASARAV